MPKYLVHLIVLISCSYVLPTWPAQMAISNAPLSINRMPLGSGQQGIPGEETAQPVGDYGVWHVPQYLPGYPTSATIWPRAVVVKCKNKHCEGYTIKPEMGPGEYLFFIPIDE